ncbi:MAG TPA: hypothetical protein DCG87_05870 [Synergistaceae bacterium]|nr:hypothetical protein [Synergistaceae bacterium]
MNGEKVWVVNMVNFLKSVRTRFIFSVLLTIAIFLGMLLFLSYNALKESALENAKELSLTVLSQTERRVDSFFGGIRELAESMSQYPAFREVRPEEMKPVILASVHARKEYLRAIYLGTAEGEMYEWGIGPGFVDNTPVFEPGYDPRTRPWFIRAVEIGRFIISEPYLYASVEAMGITGVIPVYGEDGVFTGVLGIDILLDDLAKMIEQIEIEKGGKVVLLNDKDQVIVNQFNGEKGKILSSLETFTLFDLENYEGCPSGSLMTPKDLNGMYYVTCTENETTGWKLLVAFPYEALMASALEGMKYIAFLESVMIVLMAVTLVILSNSMIMEPLKKTISVIGKLEQGDYSARLPEDKNDEFGLLARQFNNLVETVAEYGRSLEKKVKERTEALMKLQRENMRLRLIEEKERIYGYLHDSLGARLTNINISNSVAQQALGKDPETLKEMLARIEENTLRGIEDLKEILHGTAAEDRRIIDFARYLGAHVRNRLELKGIRLDYAVENSVDLNCLGRQTRFELEKIIQELTSNVLKHSKAKKVSVRLRILEEGVSLEFVDDGIGGAEKGIEKGGYGLDNIRKRVLSLGGLFELASPEDSGTSIRIVLPVKEGADEIDQDHDM